jgi:hypothetical protein
MQTYGMKAVAKNMCSVIYIHKSTATRISKNLYTVNRIIIKVYAQNQTTRDFRTITPKP